MFNLVGRYINSEINPKPAPTWDKRIQPQLARAEEQRVQADNERRAAEAAEAQRQAEQTANTAQAPYTAPQSVVGGSCADWMNAAGISDQASAYKLIMRESGCNPNAVNASSGACGLGQQLPCGKWGHVWNEPVGALVDMQAYVYGRYGSWANALAFHYSHNWY